MSDGKKIKWHDLMLTPEEYELVKDTYYCNEPTQWEIQCTNDAVKTVIAYIDGISSLHIDQYYSPEAGSEGMKEMVIRLFQEEIVLKAFAYDEVEIERAVELLTGINDVRMEALVLKLVEEMILQVNEILAKTFH